MKKFFASKVQDLSVGQSILYVLLVSIISIIFTVIALMMPQCAEDLADWFSLKLELAKKKLKKKSSFEENLFE